MWKVKLKGQLGRLAFDIEIETTRRVLVVVGENGAGKSTLVRAIAGAALPLQGEVVVGGKLLLGPNGRLPPEQRLVGHLPQQRALFPHLSVIDNVAFGPRARGATRAQALQAARLALQDAQVESLANEMPHTLSGGQSQRVALARALACDAQIWLLDEPMSAIDLGARSALRSWIASRVATRSTLLVTHDARDVRSFGTGDAWLVALADGRVVQQGAPDDVRAHPQTDFLCELLHA